MATRTATATGTVTNTGNALSSYKVRLAIQTYDPGFALVVEDEDSAIVTLDPGETSAPITLRISQTLYGGWLMLAKVILDLESPVSQAAIDETTTVRYTEAGAYGGTWRGEPTIGGFSLRGGIGRLRRALVEVGSR